MTLAYYRNNQIIYTFMCYPDGGVVDDFLVYKYGEEEYLLSSKCCKYGQRF